MTILRYRISTFLHGAAKETHVHFHQGPQGYPLACHDPACRNPRLTQR